MEFLSHLMDRKYQGYKENLLTGLRNRVFQHLARILPGAMTMRVRLHRWRGMEIGRDVWIGYDSILETSHPQLISIGNSVVISVRTLIIAHFHGATGVRIEDDVFVGPGSIILPNVRIGKGAVVAAGSVVTTSVQPGTMVQGNPARVVARCGVPLGMKTPMRDFLSHLRPLGRMKSSGAGDREQQPSGQSAKASLLSGIQRT